MCLDVITTLNLVNVLAQGGFRSAWANPKLVN